MMHYLAHGSVGAQKTQDDPHGTIQIPSWSHICYPECCSDPFSYQVATKLFAEPDVTVETFDSI